MKTIKYKNKYLSCVQKQFSKFAVVLVVASMLFGTLGINQTSAYFTSSATVSGNTFTAGTLNIATSSDDLGPVSLGVVKNYSVINQGSLPFKYEMTALISGGSDTTFCGQLSISVLNNSTPLYTGSLSGLDFTKLIGGAQNDLTFTITDSQANPAGKVCSFNFISKAWQAELDYSQGFTDMTSSKAVVYSANTEMSPVSSEVVLNEFLPNPNGSEYGFDFGNNDSHMPQGEWIELYNNSNASVNLTGWYIKDLANHTINITATNTQPATTTILAHGWLVVYMNTSILNNEGPETITLYNNLNISQDSYSYDGGTYCDMQPTPSDDNNTNPSSHCISVPPNKSYARIPDGVGAWVDPIPTPGESNIGGEVELLLENDSPVILDQTTDTLIKEIVGDSTEEVVEETATEEPATDTTTDETITADQPAQETEDVTAPDEDPAIESEATELESAVESEIASTEEVVEEEIISAEEPTDEISAESSDIQADEPEASLDEVVEVVENI